MRHVKLFKKLGHFNLGAVVNISKWHQDRDFGVEKFSKFPLKLIVSMNKSVSSNLARSNIQLHAEQSTSNLCEARDIF